MRGGSASFPRRDLVGNVSTSLPILLVVSIIALNENKFHAEAEKGGGVSQWMDE